MLLLLTLSVMLLLTVMTLSVMLLLTVMTVSVIKLQAVAAKKRNKDEEPASQVLST
jgi:hypothetical protein